ncbi:MAG: hypothetical protein COT84_06125 [Chlamydiae bacterium CG10_big_fil_rev_8_21_14_0_10_35_9]|nr:MAG: hypothetical protein COT84_06125 [Chlamydiae bacterium CG10_big_fil_rev_8_21_14_0_10_35_9]
MSCLLTAFQSLIGACLCTATPSNSATNASSESYRISTNNFAYIEEIIEKEADENTLVLWDVDQTLITPKDAILKPKWNKLLDQLMGGKKVIKDESGNKRYIFREILMHAEHSLLDNGLPSFVEKLQKKGIPTIAFTAAPGGKIGEVDSFIDWRIDELKKFGFDFSHSFPDTQLLNLPKDEDKEFPPVYKSGVLITSLHDKGPVLTNFFAQLGWTPKKVIFIDDQESNIESVASSLDGQVQTIGIEFTGAADLPSKVDESVGKYQVDHFQETGEWISQNQAESNIAHS